MPEITGPQVIIQPDPDGTLQQPRQDITYKKLREMRLDPTISLARRLMLAPVLAANWSYESEKNAPEGAQEFIAEQMQPLRTHILETGFLGCIDFGWQPYEKIYEVLADGHVGLHKLKPLLQDLTTIRVIDETGAYNGLTQTTDDLDLDLDPKKTLLLNIDVEGTNWYGRSTLANCEDAYDSWIKSDGAAERYDSKIAGAHWVVHYPVGQTPYGVDGTVMDNFEIAKKVLSNLQASGAVCLPNNLTAFTDSLDAQAAPEWRIELLSDGSGSGAFIERMKYLDALKVRAMGLPERSILEGQFGTKAEAEVHADLAITNMDMRHRSIVQMLNGHVVNDLLLYNYGPGYENTVYIEPAPITDLALQYLRGIYLAYLADPQTQILEMENVDLEALRDRLGIPMKPQADPDTEGTVPESVYPGEYRIDEEL